jgi:hypothetical protein
MGMPDREVVAIIEMEFQTDKRIKLLPNGPGENCNYNEFAGMVRRWQQLFYDEIRFCRMINWAHSRLQRKLYII